MPTNRKRIDRGRRDVLNDNQRSFLETGHYFWGGFDQPEFGDEAHRQRAWVLNRDMILDEWCHPGQRPMAFWEFEHPGGWHAYGQSESAAVHQLLKEGRLEGCGFNGCVPIEEEMAQIEADWRHWIAVALLHATSYEAGRGLACGIHYGVPVDFFDEHAPAIAAQQEAGAEDWRRKRAAMLKNDAA